jgi:hypothetical protein
VPAGAVLPIVVAMALNLAASVVPTWVAPPMIATAISAAIRPYSIAVAPDWSSEKRLRKAAIAGSRACNLMIIAMAIYETMKELCLIVLIQTIKALCPAEEL